MSPRRSTRHGLSLRHQAWLALLVPVVIVLLAQVGLQANTRRVHELEGQITQLNRWREQTSQLFQHVVSAESSVRGYRLSGNRDAAFLTTYFEARREAPLLLADMRRTGSLAPQDQRRLNDLAQLVNRRLQLLEQFRLGSDLRPGSSTVVEQVAEGRRITRAIAQEVDAFSREQARLTALRTQRLAEARRLTDLFWVVMPIAVLLGLFAVAWFASRMIGRIELLRRNTAHLVEGSPLEPMPRGGGELMDLQASLAEAAALLEQRKAEGEAARLEAERANEAKTAFLSRMSHELRTPLTAVLGFAELLEMDDLDDGQRDSVRHIRRAGRHLLTLINEVLDISRIESGHLAVSIEPLELGPVVRDTLTLIRPLAEERGIRVSADCPDRLFVRADRQRLTQVLLNLLSNAVKYNRDFGEIDVACEVDGDRVRVSVRDSGMGIAPELLPRVFAAFDRLGAEQSGIEGTGVGLTLSKGLVEVMGGSLTVASVAGAGSTFTVDLRLAMPEARPAAPAHDDEDETDGLDLPPVTVLYVEDNAANIDLVAGLLARRNGVELISTMQGRLAMDLARLHRPDLVLLDLHLPDLGGEEVLRRLRQDPETADLLVVMLTADATPGQERRLRALGADDYLTKPLDFSRVLGLLNRAALGATR